MVVQLLATQALTVVKAQHSSSLSAPQEAVSGHSVAPGASGVQLESTFNEDTAPRQGQQKVCAVVSQHAPSSLRQPSGQLGGSSSGMIQHMASLDRS